MGLRKTPLPEDPTADTETERSRGGAADTTDRRCCAFPTPPALAARASPGGGGARQRGETEGEYGEEAGVRRRRRPEGEAGAGLRGRQVRFQRLRL